MTSSTQALSRLMRRFHSCNTPARHHFHHEEVGAGDVVVHEAADMVRGLGEGARGPGREQLHELPVLLRAPLRLMDTPLRLR